MPEELNTEMIAQLFDQDIYVIQDRMLFNSFGLSEDLAAETSLLVLLIDYKHEKASPADTDLLSRIADFKDYHLDRKKVRIVNLANQTVSFIDLVNKFAPENIISFDVEPSAIGLQLEYNYNQPVLFRGVRLIFTASLHEITKNEKLKKEFFSRGLKPMFSAASPTM